MKMKDYECPGNETCPFRKSSPWAYSCGPEGCPLANLDDNDLEMEVDDFLKEWDDRNDAYAEQVSKNYERDRRRERRSQLMEDAWDDPLVRKAKARVESYKAQMNLLALAVSTVFAGTYTDRMFEYIDADQHRDNIKHVDAGDEKLKDMRIRLKELTKEMNDEHVLAFNRLVEREGI